MSKSNTWEQLGLDIPGAVTDIELRIGAVGSEHLQCQIEARDAQGNLVAMVSRPHADIVAIEQEVEWLLAECVLLIRSRHSPF